MSLLTVVQGEIGFKFSNSIREFLILTLSQVTTTKSGFGSFTREFQTRRVCIYEELDSTKNCRFIFSTRITRDFVKMFGNCAREYSKPDESLRNNWKF